MTDAGKKTCMLRARISEEDLNILSNLANKENVTAATFVRRLIREKFMRAPSSERAKLILAPTEGIRAIMLKLRAKKVSKKKGRAK